MVSRSKVKIQDIARRAGVGLGTVSRVLNGQPNVSLQAQAAVRAAIDELGYRPSSAAQILRTNRTNTLGFITDTITSTPWAGQITAGAQATAWQHGKILLLVNTEGDAALQDAAVESMLERQVEGIIYATMYHREVTPPPNIQAVPTVLLDCFAADRSLPSVVPDDRCGGYRATEILIERGHRRIGYLNQIDPIVARTQRMEGYRAALADHGIEFDAALVVEGNSDANGAYVAMNDLLSRGVSLDSVFCFKDYMAMGAYEAIREHGLKIPRDIAVIGYDNQELIAAGLRPALSTMELPHYAMGVWAVRYLLEDQPAVSGGPIQARLECPYVERESL